MYRRTARIRKALLSASALGIVAALQSPVSASTPSTSSPSTSKSASASPLAANGQLKVCDRRLCNEQGQAVQLRGMSTHGTQWYAQCVTDGSLDALAGDWRADVLRVSTYVQEGGYETDPQRYTALAQKFVDGAHRRGMYAVIDWHMLDPGDPNFNLARAKTFFTAMAKKYKDNPGVLYEIANEPSGVSWSKVKSYAEKIIPVIRAQDPDAVVLVGTRAWSSFGVSEGADEQEVVRNPVNSSNIMYTFHFYAASHRDEYLNVLDRASDRLPVFVTEFGTQDYAGEGANDFAQSQRFLDLMKRKKISWTNWNFSDDHRSGAVFKTGTCSGDTWAGTGVLKEAGVWIRQRIRE
ncbi:cellulase [Streptomyces agglomeratus]|uniref:cellulase n=1 Tax=Streptomyces agglomeratus TaxID=285458 RepID=A0A1E5PCN7_9ACTN|nr:glycoside hydrolase family 5 protein [Streptomyces agglomeratus]OEJ27301.1 cellulase [Streptomyces agglomeratus]OEJ38645.1 cellulase [Streptomyces agglomeratus]OEJ46970.1 cellulase [Streptomyces agglomeratus]OEJ51171.1 cellulase [Streptomyces agglomeratus]OEJ58541.1 cellulase [Streptomyces agglomeratus]